MPNSYWLVKQEPSTYSWSTFVQDKGTNWTGVRNYQARNNLRAMKKGDLAFFYHSGDEKQVVGIAKVAKGPYADPTATEGDWVAVDLVPIKPLKQNVTLATIKADSVLKEMLLARNSRLSVSGVTETEFRYLLKLAGTTI
ncbi:MAG: EVE domain-containing protein [Verrucomicrobia bacterium]|nr:EVE domain-containing protein [Verrucomicrobiota bacterium]